MSHKTAEARSAYNKQYRLNHLNELKQKRKIYNQINRNKHIISATKWRKDNPEKYKSTRMKWHNKNYKTNINYRLRMVLRARFYDALKRGVKTSSILNLLDCSIEELKHHLESKFYLNKETGEMMTWENRSLWHIDHIKSCVSFDLTKEEEQKKCFHWSNLQPLWAKENIAKWSYL